MRVTVNSSLDASLVAAPVGLRTYAIDAFGLSPTHGARAARARPPNLIITQRLATGVKPSPLGVPSPDWRNTNHTCTCHQTKNWKIAKSWKPSSFIISTVLSMEMFWLFWDCSSLILEACAGMVGVASIRIRGRGLHAGSPSMSKEDEPSRRNLKRTIVLC